MKERKPGYDYHIRVDIKGLLMQSDSHLHRITIDGREASPREARLYLLNELEKGTRYMPLGECNNFDPKEGCLGHDPKEAAKETA